MRRRRRRRTVEWWKACSCRKSRGSSQRFSCSSIFHAPTANATACETQVRRNLMPILHPCLTVRLNRSRCVPVLSLEHRWPHLQLTVLSCSVVNEPLLPRLPSAMAAICYKQLISSRVKVQLCPFLVVQLPWWGWGLVLRLKDSLFCHPMTRFWPFRSVWAAACGWLQHLLTCIRVWWLRNLFEWDCSCRLCFRLSRSCRRWASTPSHLHWKIGTCSNQIADCLGDLVL